ncbi:MAG: hypothetical protein AAGF47_05915 [Planctomycetota bacterium]
MPRVAPILLVLLMLSIGGVIAFHVFSPPGTRYARGDRIEPTPGLDNVIVFEKAVLSGSGPRSDESYDTLRRLGVRTILSVDAVRPNLEAIESRGMISAHVPLTYDGIDGPQRLALAKAIRDLPKPIYIHCHHGKHRGPAAAAMALVCLGEIDAAQGTELLEIAGTSPSYVGLWDDVRTAQEISGSTIDTLGPNELPAAVEVSGLPATMAEIQRVFDELRAIQSAGWRTPEDNPDLVLDHAAAALPDLFRMLVVDLDADANAGYRELMEQAAARSAAIETAADLEDWPTAELSIERLAESCIACHESYR